MASLIFVRMIANFRLAAGFFAVLAVLTLQANAETIFEDAFDRGGALAKSAPAPVNGPGAVWGDNAVLGGTAGLQTENGSLKIANFNEFVFLPFNFSYVPQKSLIILSAKVTLGGGNGKAWIGFGFAGDNKLFQTGTAWIRLCTDGKSELLKGPGLTRDSRIKNSIILAPDKAADLKITYDTSTNIAAFYLNNEVVGTFSYDSIPPIDRVFFSSIMDENDTLAGSVQGFKLDISPAP